MLKNMINFSPGLILGKTSKDWIAGVTSPTEFKERTSIWSEWKPEHEKQNMGFETSACTCFASSDAIETLLMWMLTHDEVPADITLWLKEKGYFKNGFINFSDRFSAQYAEIIVGVGTEMYKAADSFRTKGVVPEDLMPYVTNNYYTSPASDLVALGALANERLHISWQWVDKENATQYIKQAPMVATVVYADGDTILAPKGRHNHCVMVQEITDDYILINDSYNQEIKKYHPDYVDNYLQYNITFQTTMLDVNKFLQDNDLKLVRNVDTGAYGCVISKKLRVITPERAGLFMIDREARGEIGKKDMVSVNKADWDALPKENF